MSNHSKRRLIAALMRSPLSRFGAMYLMADVLNATTPEDLKRFRDEFNNIADNCYLADGGTLCVKRGDAVYAETGDRSVYINDEFLMKCSPEQLEALSAAKNILLGDVVEEEE